MIPDCKPDERAYFDRSLRSCLVDLVSACLQARPGAAKGENVLPEKYASEVLDPFFQRLARDCIENQPADPLSFMQAWTKKQSSGAASQQLLDFVFTWCGSRTDEWNARERKLAELQSKYDALTEQLKKSDLGYVLTGQLQTVPVNTEKIADESVAREKALRKEIEQAHEEIRKLKAENGKLRDASKTTKSDTAASMPVSKEAAREEIEQLKSEISQLKEVKTTLTQAFAQLKDENSKLKDENSKLKEQKEKQSDSDTFKKESAKSQEVTDENPMPKRRLSAVNEEGLSCVGVVLRMLMSQGVTSATAAFSYLGSEDDAIVTREKLTEKTTELDCLEPTDIATLCEYLDPTGSGLILFEDFKAALQRFLASSGDVHSSLTEDEFNIVMRRIKDKFDKQGLSVAQVFKEYDSDNSGTLQRHEFIEGLSKLHLGLSTKEIAQLFYAMDASGDGFLSLEEFEESITSGSANPVLDWAQSTFQRIAEILLQGAAQEACAKHAVQPELKAITHDGFVKMIAEHDNSLSLTDIGRLWCVVDKLGDSSGNADVLELSKQFNLVRVI